ncbi:Thymidine kinase [Swinepox virus]|uniref:Thymidine kinase n=1 Tax=Swinepox virus TaxID=10276 RepID=A0A881SY12_SWPV|nr:Thymidine kinase [Swinepox virus]
MYIIMSCGFIHLILGPMFSGKSTELIRLVNRYQIATYNCKVIKYSKDNRYGNDAVYTHDKCYISAVSTDSLFDIKYTLDDVDIVGIDEGQFFNDIVEFCEYMANKGKIVIVAALDGTYERKPFGNILNLIPLSEKVTKLNAICMICHRDASFSKRLSDEKEIELIGGKEKYLSVCRSCYLT